MSSPSPPSRPSTTRRNVKHSVILALATLSTVADSIHIPGAKVPAAALIELIKALEVSLIACCCLVSIDI